MATDVVTGTGQGCVLTG